VLKKGNDLRNAVAHGHEEGTITQRLARWPVTTKVQTVQQAKPSPGQVAFAGVRTRERVK
jgi:hypothetical protein